LVVVLATFAPLSLPATAAMAASLLLAAVAAPRFAHRAAALTEQAVLTTRGDVTSHSLEILDDATSLRVDGRLDGALARLAAAQDGRLLLLPLSSSEAATALPAAATQHARSRAAAERLDALIGEGGEGDDSAPVPAERPATATLTARDLTAGWSAEAPCVRGL